MSTATFGVESAGDVDEPLQYRALHTGAILGLVLGILSVFMGVAATNSLQSTLLVAPIPMLGIVVSLRALAKINREPELYAGRNLAIFGIALSFLFATSGVAYAAYVYATEVPEGYQRISFGGLKPDEIQERGDVVVPPEILALDGKKVFIKGYIRPDSITLSRGIDRFLLVRDNNQCCFGDLSTIKYYDQMDVDMTGARRVDYHAGIFRMGGVLRVQPENLTATPMKPVFSLEADYAE